MLITPCVLLESANDMRPDVAVHIPSNRALFQEAMFFDREAVIVGICYVEKNQNSFVSNQVSRLVSVNDEAQLSWKL